MTEQKPSLPRLVVAILLAATVFGSACSSSTPTPFPAVPALPPRPPPVSAPDWVTGAICAAECDPDAPVAVGELINIFERLEAAVGTPASRRSELEALPQSFCPDGCTGFVLTRPQLAEVSWRWLGSPGWPLIERGFVINEVAVAQTLFGRRLAGVDLECDTDCFATRQDVTDLVTAFWRSGWLAGVVVGETIPPDLIGDVPFWSNAAWEPADQLCLDPDGKARYGYYSGVLCVSPELDPQLRYDVAVHEVGHLWQSLIGQWNASLQKESDADCWAHLHGAQFTGYVTTGCEDDAQAQRILLAYADSLGFASTELTVGAG